MKFLIVFVALFVFALAAPQNVVPKDYPPEILRQSLDSDDKPEGYANIYESSDGTSINEQGRLEDCGIICIGGRAPILYVAPDGTPISVSFIADENVIQTQGTHLPVAPTIPSDIALAISQIDELKKKHF